MTLLFDNVADPPVPSLLRGFSAPVNLRFDYSADMLAHLMAHDSDPFNRWEAGQRLALDTLLAGIDAYREGRDVVFPEAFVDAFARVLADSGDDPAFTAEALALPQAGYIAEQLDEVDPDAILAVRTGLRRHVATCLESAFEDAYARFVVSGDYNPDPASAGRRGLRNLCLSYLMELETSAIRQRALAQLNSADNMTDAMAALGALANSACPERNEALSDFYDKWRDEPLVIDKWFSVQAVSRLPGTLGEVRRLMQHADYDASNPNRIRAVVGAFCHGNHVRFHAADGAGYDFAAEQVIALDAVNAQIAARIARAFDRWRKFDAVRQDHARQALERIRDASGLSKDTFEVVTRALD